MVWGLSGGGAPRSSICCGGAACWVRAYAEVGREPSFPSKAFRSLLQQRAYKESLRLRSLGGVVLLIYLLLPFFSPEAPPLHQIERQGPPQGHPEEGAPKARPTGTQFVADRVLEEGVLGWGPPGGPPEAPMGTLEALWTPRQQQQQQEQLQQQQQQLLLQYDELPQLLLQLPLRSSRGRRQGGGPYCDSVSGQCLIPPISNSSSSKKNNNNSSNSSSSSSSGGSSLFSVLFEPWESPLSPESRRAVLWLVSLLCVSFLGHCSLLAVISRGFSCSAAVPAAVLACCLVSAADYSLLLFGDIPPAAAAAAAAAGGAWRATRLARPLLLCGLQHSARALLVRIVKTLPQVATAATLSPSLLLLSVSPP